MNQGNITASNKRKNPKSALFGKQRQEIMAITKGI